ncbi:MAG: GtrA family protein [Prevotellaceae bacterium]|jgi:putative flippase GtrA|nr:GtrA family protein [Prevotellaceae bacterium]
MWRYLKPFIKAQLSAGIGYVCDYSSMLILKELLGVYYLVAIGIGGIVGAIINFLINHYWAFRSKDKSYRFGTSGQLWRFVCVVISGISLKIIGTNLLTILTHVDYKLTRLVMDALVAVFFNYLLQRYFVFKQRSD